MRVGVSVDCFPEGLAEYFLFPINTCPAPWNPFPVVGVV